MVDLAALRRTIRAQRRAIQGMERQEKSAQAARHLLRHLPAGARRIAAFLSLPEEIDTAPLIRALWQRGICVYLPYTRAHGGALQFLPYQQSSELLPDGLGIPAPRWQADKACSGAALDLAIVPLVAWDARGNRLGMGGGFYDRTFAAPERPPLWGLAYDCQQVAALEPAAWDVRLDALVSESGRVIFEHTGR